MTGAAFLQLRSRVEVFRHGNARMEPINRPGGVDKGFTHGLVFADSDSAEKRQNAARRDAIAKGDELRWDNDCVHGSWIKVGVTVREPHTRISGSIGSDDEKSCV